MNNVARTKLLSNPWEPKTYHARELVTLLGITLQEAVLMVVDINSVTFLTPFPWWITHHDLVLYLQDFTTITEVPEHKEEISRHGQWLLSKGWGIDPTRKTFRWIDPEMRARRLTLKGALFIALARERDEEPCYSDEQGNSQGDVIDAEFEVRSERT
jgi:hypothetical protein